ncbi:MAG: SpoIID/LytB domain-containing protein [Candidatus Eremiobacteraeota bacterium]|nr:SpoIID/LytB domain-containing protein [Candidatus Eremiobacteraeota bacterium]
MKRRAFIGATAAALVASRRPARATGGRDIADSATQHNMRVLLATGSFASARQLDAWHFVWSGRTYRGTFAGVPLPDGRQALVNTLPLDAYLYGVLSKEVSASWPAAAQQAQAIASRTYALGKLRPAKPFDIVAGEIDQAYGGIESETVEGRAAVDATGGIIATYGDLPARIVYSACCGGRTADAGDVWNTPYAYLTSIADPYCAGTPSFEWQTDIGVDAVVGAYRAQFAGIGSLRAVEIHSDDPGGRPRSIDFVGSNSTFATTPSAFRASLGPSVVRSAFVRGAVLQRAGTSLALSGTGRGHGVGMCQWGARVMGERGHTPLDIVAFYFPGTAFGRG